MKNLSKSKLFWEATLILGAAVVGLFLEDWSFSHTMAEFVDATAQRAMSQPAVNQVVVCDISGLSMIATQWPGVKAVDRSQLLKLISRVCEYHPAAIGVDVDMSLEWIDLVGANVSKPLPNTGYRKAYTFGGMDSHNVRTNTLSSPQFMESLDRLADQRRVHIVLGVFRQADQPEAEWFFTNGEGEGVNNIQGGTLPVLVESAALMPLWHKGELQDYPVPSFSLRLASALREEPAASLGQPVSLLLANRFEVDLGESLKFSSMLVNYSGIEKFKVVDGNSLLSEGQDYHKSNLDALFSGKIVILGKATLDPDGTEDRFRIPGGKTEYPGVFLHASAVATLLETAPLAPTKLLALICEFLVFFTIALFVHRLESKQEPSVEKTRAARILWFSASLLLPLVVSLVLFYLGVIFLRVIWIGILLLFLLHLLVTAIFALPLGRLESHSIATEQPHTGDGG